MKSYKQNQLKTEDGLTSKLYYILKYFIVKKLDRAAVNPIKALFVIENAFLNTLAFIMVFFLELADTGKHDGLQDMIDENPQLKNLDNDNLRYYAQLACYIGVLFFGFLSDFRNTRSLAAVILLLCNAGLNLANYEDFSSTAYWYLSIILGQFFLSASKIIIAFNLPIDLVKS